MITFLWTSDFDYLIVQSLGHIGTWRNNLYKSRGRLLFYTYLAKDLSKWWESTFFWTDFTAAAAAVLPQQAVLLLITPRASLIDIFTPATRFF